MMIKKLKNNSLIILSIIALFSLNTTNAQVGIGTTSPDESASLELQSTSKGFLPPRMTDAQRNAIGTPADGLTIFNTTVNCLQWYNGIGWFDGCDGSISVPPVIGITGNSTCSAASISVTPCSLVPGTTQSSSQPHANGTLYDWTDAGSYMSGGTANALVEIGGQCWFGRNTNAASPYTGTNNFDGFYDGGSEPAVGEGRLYQWEAAMNGSDTERAQGVCPTGWHVPSDCEWMYLENTLVMSTADQVLNNAWRASGDVGGKLSTLTKATSGSANGTGTNSSGFTALFAGNRTTNGTFGNRGTLGNWWSSSEASTANAQGRALHKSQAGVYRASFSKADGFSVRCLKD